MTRNVSSTSSRINTGGAVSLGYGFETGFNTTQSTIGNIFGLNQKVSNLTLNTSQVSLNKLGQVEPTKFYFGQQSGQVGVGFVFDDNEAFKIFRCIYENSGSNIQSSSPFNYPASLGENTTGDGTPATITTRIQMQNGSNMITRTLSGCVVTSIGISTSIGETVNGTVDMSFAQESTGDVETTANITAQTTTGASGFAQGGTPYTFAHGKVKMATGASDAYVEVFDIQDIDLSFAPNAEMLYALGSHYARNAFRRIFDVGGRFRTTHKDGALLQYVINQSIAGLETETVAEGTGADAGVGLELTFTNGSNIMEIEFGGVSLSDHSTSGLEPAEPIYEEVNFKAKSSHIKITT